MKKILSLGLLFLCMNFIDAQIDFCASSDIEQAARKKDSLLYDGARLNFWKAVEQFRNANPTGSYMDNPYDPLPCENCLVTGPACPKAKFVIPVVVHIVYSGSIANLNTAQIQYQLDLLNKHFSNKSAAASPAVNTGIQFILANKDINGNAISGITRHNTGLANHKKIKETSQLMQLGITGLPMSHFMHIWVVESIRDTMGNPTNIQGYSTMPGTVFSGSEGIVVKYDWFGDYNALGSPFNVDSRGNTLTHEVGHYLGLLHPFEGGCKGLSSVDCSKEGDHCCDVPAVSGQSQSCAFSNSCMETYNNNPPDQKQNYMDYSLQSCKTTFTSDQTTIMHTTLLVKRQALWQPIHVNRFSNSVCLLSATFRWKTKFMCKNTGGNPQTDTFTAYAISGVTYKWKASRRVNNVYTSYKSQSGGNPVFTISNTDTGNYTISLTVYNSNDTVIQTESAVLRVEACGGRIPSYRGSWEFGKMAGLGFYSGNRVYRDLGPSLNFPNIDAEESSITMNDSLGNLLFYGSTQYPSVREFNVFGYNYKLLPGGPIQGLNAGIQQAVAIPSPDSKNYFFIVHACGPRYYDKTFGNSGYKYSIVRADVSNHTGDSIVKKDMDIRDNSGRYIGGGGSVTAIRHCNNKQYWVLCKGVEDTVYVLLTNANKTISFNGWFLCGEDQDDCPMNSSPDGKLISIGRTVFSFDRNTGITKFIFRDSLMRMIDFHVGPWGAAFSNDNRVLYRSYMNYDSINDIHFAEMYQYNMESNAPDKSRKKLFNDHDTRTLQNGPDSKIYLSVTGMPFVSVFNQPDKLSSGTDNANDYQFHGPDLGEGGIGGIGYLDLPNFANTSIPSLIKPDFRAVIKNCDTLELVSNQSCSKAHRWFFGNGDSSHLESPKYRYNTKGTYIVRLIIGKDTATKTIKMELPKLSYKISGDTLSCDSTQVYEYKSGKGNDLVYNWTCSNCVGSISDKEVFETRWKGIGKLKITIKDRATGCLFADSIKVKTSQPILGNTLIYDTLFCKGSGVLISGTSASGGNGTFVYSWYKSIDGKSWDVVKDSSRKSLFTLNPADFYYYRMVSSGCNHVSNISKKGKLYFLSNAIKISKNACLKGKTVKITGYGIKTNVPGFYYVWQYSTDNVNWYNDPVQSGYSPSDTSKLNRYSFALNSRIYVRRKLTYNGCDEYSNVIFIARPNEIRRQPLPAYVCHLYYGGNANFKMQIKLNKYNSASIGFIWQIQQPAGNWINLPLSGGGYYDSSVTSSNSYSTSYSPGSSASIRCLIISCGDTLYSNLSSVTFSINTTPSFSKVPVDQMIQSGQKAKLTAKSSNGSIRWQLSINRGVTWTDIPDSEDTLLSVGAEDFCNLGITYPNGYAFNRTMYRAVVSNGCRSVTSGHVFVYLNNRQPIIRDDPFDKGKEPSDTFINGGHLIRNPMLSPDIAVSYSASDNPFVSGYTDFMLNPTVGTNYIWVRVKNRGNAASSPIKLDLHWSLSSTGLKWTQNWTANVRNRFYNTRKGQYFYMGGKINPVQIQVPSIAAGQTTYIMYAWNASQMPDPSNYYRLVKRKLPNAPGYYYDTTFYTIAQNINLLARMQECQNFGNGFTFPETINSNENCRLNNRIAAKNLILSLIKPNMGGPGEVYANDHPVVIRNAKDSGDAVIALHFNAKDANVGSIVRVVATMDSVLEQTWTAGGSMGTGFNIIEPHRLEITDFENFSMENITLDTLTEGAIYFDFYLLPGPTGAGTRDYTFDVWQTSDKDSMPEGFVRILLNAPNLPDGHNFGESRQVTTDNPLLKSNQKGYKFVGALDIDSTTFARPIMRLNAYPNPSDGQVTLSWNCDCSEPFVIELVSSLGEKVYATQVAVNPNGQYNILIPMEGLADGIYTVRILSANYNASVKITLIQ